MYEEFYCTKYNAFYKHSYSLMTLCQNHFDEARVYKLLRRPCLVKVIPEIFNQATKNLSAAYFTPAI